MSYNMFCDRVTYSFGNARPYKSAHQCHCTPDRGSSSVKHVAKQIFSDAFFLPSFLFPQLHLTFAISFILQRRETSVGCCCMGAIDCFAVRLNVNIWISEWACNYWSILGGIFVRVTGSLCCADSGTAVYGLCIRWPWWLWSVWTRIMRRLLTETRWDR